MRILNETSPLSILSPEVLSVLQLCATYERSEPLFPNLKALMLWGVNLGSIPFIPLFLSPGTIVITIGRFTTDLPKAMIASMIATLPTTCPNLQEIGLFSLPNDPMVIAAVSGMLLTPNRNALRRFHADCPLTQEACDVIYKLPSLCELRVVIGRNTSIPPLALPNLVNLIFEYEHDSGWLEGLRGATFGKLASLTVRSESNSIGNFLEAFEGVALTTPTSVTLSTFRIQTPCPWRPNYRCLLPFTQLRELAIDFSCEHGCSSTIDDDTITDMARTMSNLEVLRLGRAPCKTPTGVTFKGLAALAYHCLHLSTLRIHFQADNLHPLPASTITSGGKPTISRAECLLTVLEVGEIPVAEESALMVALTLLRIFPRLDFIEHSDGGWGEVAEAIGLSKQLADASSKKPSLTLPRSNIDDTSPSGHIRGCCLNEKRPEVVVYSGFTLIIYPGPFVSFLSTHHASPHVTSLNKAEHCDKCPVELRTSDGKSTSSKAND